MGSARVLDPRAFGEDARAFMADFETVDVAEFLITAIDVDPGKANARTEVRYEIVGHCVISFFSSIFNASCMCHKI
jgi:hypothetical protein